LTAEAGTAISGKVVRQDGKPIGAGTQVYAAPAERKNENLNLMPPMAKVAADGTYSLTKLAPGSYSISLYVPTKAGSLIDSTPVKVTAAIETPGVAPDLVWRSRQTVTGTVLGADTKKPIANVSVSIQTETSTGDRLSQIVQTDADGIFKAQPSIGKYAVKIDNAPGDYVSDPNAQPVTLTLAAGQTVNLDPLLLNQAPVVTGTAVDNSGRPVSNVVLKTENSRNDGTSSNIPAATTNDSGAFSLHRLTPGEFWIDAGRLWKVVSPKSFTVPVTSPIKLVLKRNPTDAVQGIAVDTSHVPVAGAVVTFYIEHDTNPGYPIGDNVDVTTDKDGTYTVPDAPIDFNMVHRGKVTMSGFVLKSGGDVRISNGRVVVTPIVMALLGGKVNGTVVNAVGKPVAGAWVLCMDSESGTDTSPVRTNASGHFELTNLTIGSVAVYAGKGLFFNKSILQSTASHVQSVVRLPAVPTAPTGKANLRKSIAVIINEINSHPEGKDNDSGGLVNDDAVHIIAEISPDAAVRYILAKTSINTWDLGCIASARAYSDPVGIARWALVPIKRISGGAERGQTAAAIGLAAALYDRAAGAPYYDIATKYIHFNHLDEVWINNVDGDTIANATTLTALAFLLHRPEADDDYAKVRAGLDHLIKNSKNDPNAYYDSQYLPLNLAKIIALGNVDKAIAMLNALPDSSRYNNVAEIINELIKPNPAAAMAIYHWVAQEPSSSSLSWAQNRALCRVLPIIYKTDPKGAIEKAHSITDSSEEAQALTELADLMPLTDAAPLYAEAEDKAFYQLNNGYSPACIAYHAWRRDSVLGAKLFKTAFTEFVTVTAKPQVLGTGPNYPDFAFYYSHIDPAYSRLLMEAQFVKNLNATEHLGGDSDGEDVAAMCAIDINRAVELAGEIKDPYASFSAGLKPAQYLLLTPQQRDAIPFEDWANSTDWVPGTPSN
jgi:hypothetical protein